MASISREVSKSDRFPLQKLISKIMIGRGDKSFHMNVFDLDPNKRRTFSVPQKFSEFSQTFEMPISELFDPEGEILRRLERLNLKIEDIKVNNE